MIGTKVWRLWCYDVILKNCSPWPFLFFKSSFLLCAVVWDVLLILLLLFDSSTALRGERCSDKVSFSQNPVLWERGSSSVERMFFLWSPLPRVMHLLLTSSAPRPVSMSVIDKWLTAQRCEELDWAFLRRAGALLNISLAHRCAAVYITAPGSLALLC